MHKLSDSDCKRLELPYGSTDPDVFVFPLGSAAWHRFDVWMETDADGSRCLNLDFLKHHGEIHFAPKRVNAGAANGR